MVRGTLNDDKPAFFRIVSDLVNLEGDPVVSAPYSGAKGLISTAAQRGAYHDAAVKQLVADRKYRQPGDSRSDCGARQRAHFAPFAFGARTGHLTHGAAIA